MACENSVRVLIGRTADNSLDVLKAATREPVTHWLSLPANTVSNHIFCSGPGERSRGVGLGDRHAEIGRNLCDLSGRESEGIPKVLKLIAEPWDVGPGGWPPALRERELRDGPRRVHPRRSR